MTEPTPTSATDELELQIVAELGERRRYPRRRIRDLPLVQPVLGEVVNMSAGGVSVLTDDALPVNKELYVSFGPPDQRVRVRARVVWCRLRPTQPGVDWIPKYQAGIEFLDFPS